MLLEEVAVFRDVRADRRADGKQVAWIQCSVLRLQKGHPREDRRRFSRSWEIGWPFQRRQDRAAVSARGPSAQHCSHTTTCHLPSGSYVSRENVLVEPQNGHAAWGFFDLMGISYSGVDVESRLRVQDRDAGVVATVALAPEVA